MNVPDEGTVNAMLRESNAIEEVFSEHALHDAVKAWEYAVRVHDKIDVLTICFIHKILMQNLDYPIAGKIREVPVFIGGDRREPDNVMEDLSAWSESFSTDRVSNLRKTSETMRDAVARNRHVLFEHIHPFVDGNGRTGRILYNIERLRLGLDVHVIERAHRQEYYQWF